MVVLDTELVYLGHFLAEYADDVVQHVLVVNAAGFPVGIVQQFQQRQIFTEGIQIGRAHV